MKIVTQHIFPAIPDRRFDWMAYADSYDGAPDSSTRGQIGYGATKQAAINDLMDNVLDRSDASSTQQFDDAFRQLFGVAL